jgi:hypothetical protein
MEWMWLKMARRKLIGTSGLGLGSETSQMRSLPPTWNSLICREVEAAPPGSPCSQPVLLPAGGGLSRPLRVWPAVRRRSRVRRTPPTPPAAQLVKTEEDLACLSAGR